MKTENREMEKESIEKEIVVEEKNTSTEKNDENNDEIKKKGFFKRMSLAKKIIFVIVVVILLAVAATGITLIVVRERGKASLHDLSQTKIDPNILEESKHVYYDGKEYQYNDNLINILLIGTDCTMTVSQRREANLRMGAGCADTLFLVSINPEKKTVDCISINRHTMTKIDYYAEGLFANTGESQVTLQYTFGAGLEDSSSLTAKAVSGIMGNIPIHGYVSLSLFAIQPLNNAVGGVELEVIEDIPGRGINEINQKPFDYGIGDELLNSKGKTITLSDAQAYAYLRYRGANVGDSDKRLDRQRQYLKALVKKIINNTKKDITFPMKVRDALSEWLVTDIDDDELIYLCSSLIFYNLNLDSVTHLPGTTKQEEDNPEEFYLDKDAMREIIINRFYKPVS